MTINDLLKVIEEHTLLTLTQENDPFMEADIIACAARSVVRDEIFDKEVTRVTASSGQLKVYFASDKEVQP